jgi:hypothetical protein
MRYSFLAEGYIPIMEAASLLAFGDAEFLNHILGEKFDAVIGRELLVAKECPEIDREQARLINEHTAGRLVIIGRRCALPDWRGQIRSPDPKMGEICNRYDAFPPDYFRFNDWSFGGCDPFGVIALGSDPFDAEWFYPAIALKALSKLRDKPTPRGRTAYPFWPDARAAAMKWLRDEGCPSAGDGGQANLERHIAEWLDARGHAAEERSVRNHVKKWIKDQRAELGIKGQ